MTAALKSSMLCTAAAVMGTIVVAEPGSAQTGSIAAASLSSQADQATAPNGRARGDSEEIVITGTLIRGIAPAGNNVISINKDQAAASGGTTTNQILNSLPQVGNFFNALPAGVSPQSGANASNPISRPNLRNLPGANTSGGAQTLVLIDGHRVVGAGISQVAVDPDIVAPGVIERVEALTDGGSAVYGSDALGGVLNLITRRKFNGLQTSARYGFGDNFRTYDASVMAGRDWGTGGFYIAYGYAHHDSVYGSDRNWVRQINWNTGVPTGRNCASPNITVSGTSYVVAGAGLTAGGPNTCDISDGQAIYPTNTLHTAYARLVQDLNDWIHVDISALYANRKIKATGGALGTGTLGSGAAGQATLTANSPSYLNPGGTQAGLSETVTFDYSPLFGARSATQRTSLESYSIDPSVAFDLGHGWQARGLFSYGYALTSFENAQVSAVAQAAALAAGTLNPFAIGNTSSTVASNLRQYLRGSGRNELFDYRAIVDGPLFNIAGGPVRIAAGYEHMHDHFRQQTSNTTTYALLAPNDYIQKVDSAFGELQVPLVGYKNEMAMLRALTLSASARYDRYNDFGHTFNPKFGATWKPVNWISIRGNYGKSFNAPTPVDQLGIKSSAAAVVPAQFLTAAPPGIIPRAGEVGVFVSGTASSLTPQKATNWSIGAEIKPPVLKGVTLNASYYHIDLKGTIGRPVSSSDLTPFYAGFPDLYVARPTGQQLAAYVAQFNPSNVSFVVTNPTSTAQATITGAGQVNAPVLVTLDTRGRNLGRSELSGIDFSANYVMQTGFGSVDANFAGNYRLKQTTQSSPTTVVTNDLFLQSYPRMLFQGTVGVTYESFRAQIIVNHTSGYDRGDGFVLNSLSQPTATLNAAAFGQTHVRSFNAINLFFCYGAPKQLLGPGFEFTINVQNILDASPPLYKNAAQNGYNATNGQAFSIGRVIQFGVSKKL